MIEVKRAKPPKGFERDVGKPGRAHVDELLAAAAKRKRPLDGAASDGLRSRDLKPLWREYLPQLRQGYDDICAYLGMRIHTSTGAATVDHFKPKGLPKFRKQAYSWSNFRLASAQMNTNKGDHQDVLDPFKVQSGWFVLDLPTFEVRPGHGLPPRTEQKVVATIRRLKLNSTVNIAAREEYYNSYIGFGGPPLPLAWLEAECPYVAHELRRQNKLRPPIAMRVSGSSSLHYFV